MDKQTELVALVKGCFDLQRWGFEPSYCSPPDVSLPYVIYDSEWCRVKFMHYGSDYPGQPWTEMHILYGRLHAQNDESFMIWNGEKCWCWHSLGDYVLNFLDGLSPEDVVKRKHEPRVIENFRNSEMGKAVHGPEWVARMHMAVWKHYGRRLFKLFDLNRPELWEQYRSFLKRVKDIEDEEGKKKKFPREKNVEHPEVYEVC